MLLLALTHVEDLVVDQTFFDFAKCNNGGFIVFFRYQRIFTAYLHLTSATRGDQHQVKTVTNFSLQRPEQLRVPYLKMLHR
ncbi:hypothetical protein HR12_05480 [Microbacterium sp. SUBG005]|nr:hypothetical protein HR12_05480 [Microbacterium sp. SUBG005]